MRTALLSAALTVAFLGAGAYGSANAPAHVELTSANVTVIEKNQAWPRAEEIVADGCSLVRCIDI